MVSRLLYRGRRTPGAFDVYPSGASGAPVEGWRKKLWRYLDDILMHQKSNSERLRSLEDRVTKLENK